MRKVILAAVMAASVVSISTSAFATMSGHMPAAFGPVYAGGSNVNPAGSGHIGDVVLINTGSATVYVGSTSSVRQNECTVERRRRSPSSAPSLIRK